MFRYRFSKAGFAIIIAGICAALLAPGIAGARVGFVTGSGIFTSIDSSTNQPLGSVPEPSTPTFAAASPDGKRLYVSNVDRGDTGKGIISVIDTSTNAIIDTVDTGTAAGPLAVTPDGSFLYVAVASAIGTYYSDLKVIDTKKLTIVKSIEAIGGNGTNGRIRGISMISAKPGTGGHRALAYLTDWDTDGPLKSKVIAMDAEKHEVMGSSIRTGPGPFGVASSPDGERIYVTDVVVKTASVIDVATNRVLHTVDLSGHGTLPGAIDVSPDGTVFVGYRGNGPGGINTVSIIDAPITSDTPTITDYTSLPSWANDLAAVAGPNGTSRVFVRCNTGFVEILEYDKANQSVVERARLSVYKSGSGLQEPYGGTTASPDPDGAGPLEERVYVANGGPSNTISYINTSYISSIGGTVKTSSDRRRIVITPDGLTAFAADFDSGDLSVIDTTGLRFASTVKEGIGKNPFGLAIDTAGDRLYVTNSGSGTVSVIDPGTGRPVDGSPINVGAKPMGVSVSSDGKTLYVANEGSGSISVVDNPQTPGNATVETIDLNIPAPRNIALTPDGSRLLVTHPGKTSKSVTMLEGPSHPANAVQTTLTVGYDPIDVAVVPDLDGSGPMKERAYVTSRGDGKPGGEPQSVSVLDVRDGTTIKKITRGISGLGLEGVGLSPDGKNVYISNSASSFITIITNADDKSDIDQTGSLRTNQGPAYTAIVPNKAPSANASVANLGTAGSSTTLTAQGSSDPDGEVASYEWSFGDGSVTQETTEPTAQHVYKKPGVYTARLRVVDNERGSTDTVSLNGQTPLQIGSVQARTDIEFNVEAQPSPGGLMQPGFTGGQGTGATAGSGSEVGPGAGAEAGDLLAPSSWITNLKRRCRKRSKHRSKKTGKRKCLHRAKTAIKKLRKLRRISGIARDNSGGSGVEMVEVAIGREVIKHTRSGKRKKRCVWLTRRGRKRRSCKEPVYLKAKIKSTKGSDSKVHWSYRLSAAKRKRLRRGRRYIAISRASDVAGNRERKTKRYRNLARFSLTRSDRRIRVSVHPLPIIDGIWG